MKSCAIPAILSWLKIDAVTTQPILLRGDLFVRHVTGAQKYNLCLDRQMFYLRNKPKIKGFWMVRKRENIRDQQ